MTRITKQGLLGRYAAWAGACALVILGVAACENSLKVTNPQNFTTDVLDDVKILQSVADGVEGSLQQTFGQVVVFNGLMSDEIEDSSTWINWANMSLGRFAAGAPDDQGTQTALLRTRFAAQDAVARIARVIGADGAAKSTLTAQVKTADAWIDLYLAMTFCESPLISSGPSAPDSAVYKQALTKFTDAIAAATAANATAIKNWALAGRARTNLLLGNYDAAAADAAAVPAGFLKQALFSTNSATSWAGNQLNQARNRSGTLRRTWWPVVDTSNVSVTPTPDQFVKDPWTNQNDARMVVLHTKGLKGVSNQALYYGIQKYKDWTAPITMTSKREMNLIQAEVYWRKGDLVNAVATLNIGRTAAGLPAFVMPLTSNDVLQRLLSERFAELFVEGHRMTDLDRFNLVAQQLGTGRAKKYQLTLTEILNNPSMTLGSQTCPAKS
jgi:starch-binding outer membrane protein, SusD/RagB family